jgi:GNAT acetyltransferase-like protein
VNKPGIKVRERMSYEVVTPAPADQWEAVLRASPDAMAFHSPAWLAAVCASRGWRDSSRLYRMPSGRRLVLPMVSRGAAGLVERASLPYGWGFGGVVTDGPVCEADLATVTSDLAALGGLRTSVRPNPLHAKQWRAATPVGVLPIARSAHVLDLGGGFDEVWSRRFTGSARTAVRKAERQQLEVESDTAGRLLPVFYDLYERSIRRWNRRAHARWRARRRDPLSKFQAAVENAGRMIRIWVASRGGEPAAAIVTVGLGQTLNYWRGAMDEALAGPTRANYLLHRLAIEAACDAGCSTYHMGETGGSASLSQFKTRFGAEPVAYQELRIEPPTVTRATAETRLVVERLRSVVARAARGGDGS